MACESLAKPFLIIVNLVLFLAGAALLAIGILLNSSNTLITDIIDPFLKEVESISNGAGLDINAPTDVSGLSTTELLETVGIVCIAFGVVMAVIGFLGCAGACCSVSCLLILYALVVGILLLLKIVFLVLMVTGTFNDEIKATIQNVIDDEYEGIDDFNDIGSIVFNVIMIEFECCGIDGYEDFDDASKWDRNRSIEISGQPVNVTLETPIACCKFDGDFPEVNVKDPQCSFNATEANSNYNTGCWNAVQDAINSEFVIVLVVYVGIMLFETLCVGFAICIYKKIKSAN